MPSNVVARCVHAFSGGAAVPTAFCSPPMFICPVGRTLPLLAYSAYAMPLPFCLKITVRHVLPSALGLTHASSVMALLRRSKALSGTAT